MAYVVEGKLKKKNGIAQMPFKMRLSSGELGGSVLERAGEEPKLEFLCQHPDGHAYAIIMTFAEYRAWKENADAAINAFLLGGTGGLQ